MRSQTRLNSAAACPEDANFSIHAHQIFDSIVRCAREDLLVPQLFNALIETGSQSPLDDSLRQGRT